MASRSLSKAKQRLSTRKSGRWLLFSDLHFKQHDLDRVRQSAAWILDQAAVHGVSRAIVCGDLLTSRTMQPTHVLSACYRFISTLSDLVPRVHVLLGNHDLAYRRDYQTTALDALTIKRLSPHVSLHSDVECDEWDGRRVMLLPFREDQAELTDAVAALPPREAAETVAFAHLAINRAITQRHVVGGAPALEGSVTHRGLTRPDQFSTLARTFTGHFHSHQIIAQTQCSSSHDDPRGSITYLGSPLQLTWSDLHDERRGVTLLDPDTLAHEMLVNPHAVGYTAADLHEVLDGRVDEASVQDKHVMLLGALTRLRFVTARDKLLSLGVRSVRSWNPAGLVVDTNRQPLNGLGASVPSSDAAMQPSEEQSFDCGNGGQDLESINLRPDDTVGTEPASHGMDMMAEARDYVASIELDEALSSRRDELLRVGQRVMQRCLGSGDANGDASVRNYQDFLDSSPTGGRDTGATVAAAAELAGSPTHIFVAEPRTMTITNFLGVQGTLTIDFRREIPHGLTFLIGENGSGKSTLVEAIVWCQFGRCIRSGLAVNDVVNDRAGKNCSVVLDFANGWSIARHRKHKTCGNRVIVSLHGEPQSQLEQPDARTTQAAIDQLLGIDYDTYVRTVVLGHESAASFLNSTPIQRRELIEESLGLAILDHCDQMARSLLKGVEQDIDKAESRLKQTIFRLEDIQQRVDNIKKAQQRLEVEIQDANESVNEAVKEHAAAENQVAGEERTKSCCDNHTQADTDLLDLEQQISTANSKVHELLKMAKLAELSMAFYTESSILQSQIRSKQAHLQAMLTSQAQSRVGRVMQRLTQRLETLTMIQSAGLRKLLYRAQRYMLLFSRGVVKRIWYLFGARSSDDTAATDDNPEMATAQLNLSIQKLEYQAHPASIFATLAARHGVDVATIQEAIATVPKGSTHKVNEQLAEAFQIQRALQDAREQQHVHSRRHILEQQRARDVQQARARTIDAIRQQVALKKNEMMTYERLVKTEQASLSTLQSEQKGLVAEQTILAADRDVFAFWTSAFAKRSRRSSSNNSTTAKTTMSFRQHVLKKSLSELNRILAGILTAFYDDTRHAQAMTSGMLKSLFEEDDQDDDADSPDLQPTSVVLDGSLSISTALAYGKRSGGERKRIDLALFFALQQLGQASSAHRAHYVLVDEVFDSLDAAGQAAVVRWCALLARQRRVGWIVVITHSLFLIDWDAMMADRQQDDDGLKSTVRVIRAQMGENGSELFAEGETMDRIGMIQKQEG